jgi:hypothetical protein
LGLLLVDREFEGFNSGVACKVVEVAGGGEEPGLESVEEGGEAGS